MPMLASQGVRTTIRHQAAKSLDNFQPQRKRTKKPHSLP
jgi:hypothetical protein